MPNPAVSSATALTPFVAAYGLLLNPEDLDELAYAVVSHLDTDESLQDIYDSVQRQIAETAPAPTPQPGRATRLTVWVFHGDAAPFASAVFLGRTRALQWVSKHSLTEYPAGDGCYDIAIAEGHFTPTQPHHGSPGHIASFSPSQTEHIHLRNGQPD